MANTVFSASSKARSIGLIIIGSMFCLVGIWFFIDTQVFLSQAIQTNGTIIQLIEENGKNGIIYRPVFSFIDKNGLDHQVKSIYASSPPIGEIGDRLGILYRADNPSNARIRNIFFLYFFPMGFCSIGVIIFLVRFFLYRKRKLSS